MFGLFRPSVSLECVGHDRQVWFRIVTDSSSKRILTKEIGAAFPESVIRVVPLSGSCVGEVSIPYSPEIASSLVAYELGLRRSSRLPLRTYAKMENDPLNSIIASLGEMDHEHW
jgi:hypothetical protein